MSRRRSGFSKMKKQRWRETLVRQLLAAILILLFIIAIKKMDIVMVNRTLETFETQISVNYTLRDMGRGLKSAFVNLKDGTVTMVAAIRDGSRRIEFSDPADGPGSLMASAGSGGGKAIQYSAKEELQVYAAAGGTVVEIPEKGQEGSIRISHGNDVFSVYRGCSETYIKALEKVRKGQIIGTVPPGENNRLTFEIWAGGKLADPLDYMKF